MLRRLTKVTQKLRGQDAQYSEEVKAHVERGKAVKQKVLDDLLDKLAAHHKAQMAMEAQHKALAAAFAQYAEQLAEPEPALAEHFKESGALAVAVFCTCARLCDGCAAADAPAPARSGVVQPACRDAGELCARERGVADRDQGVY